MKSQPLSTLLFLSLFLLVTVAFAATARSALAGGWSPIKDVKDPHVREIGKFAVTEYNSQAKAGLVFDRVLSGETQVVAGTNYRLVISAKTGGTVKKYQAIVWEKTWEKFMKLTSFSPISG